MTKKKPIPTALKYLVWETYFKMSKAGNCICCNCPITDRSCVYGHVLSQKDGGENTLNNLRPICMNCNSSMGSKHMVQFVKQCGFTLHESLQDLDNGEKELTNVYECRSQKMIQIMTSDIKFEIPDFQRIINQFKVDEIVDDFRVAHENNRPFNIAGCIIIATLIDDENKKWIIDGMHRLTAYGQILKRFKVNISMYVNIHLVKSYEDAKDLFLTINKSTPMPELPEVYDKISVSKIIQYVRDSYPAFVKLTNNPHIPHININRLQEALCKYNDRLDENIINKFEKLNHILKTYGYGQYIKKYIGKDVAQDLITKIHEKGGFYLGAIPNYQWIDIVMNEF